LARPGHAEQLGRPDGTSASRREGDTGGAHHLIEHERDRLLPPEGDVEAPTYALERLQQNPNLCRRLGDNGLAKVRRSFTVERIVAKLRAVLDMLGSEAEFPGPMASFHGQASRPIDQKSSKLASYQTSSYPGATRNRQPGASPKYFAISGHLSLKW
jgi:hypothetical protein